MPGRSKKGGGLEVKSAYKKQAYGTAKSPFAMKGWSPFTQKTGKGPTMPKDHPVTPLTAEQSKKSEGTVERQGMLSRAIEEKVFVKPLSDQWKQIKKSIKSKIKERGFWGWPIDR